MGKIRTKIIGMEDVEKEQEQKAKARREAKKLLKNKKEAVEIEEEKATPPKVKAEKQNKSEDVAENEPSESKIKKEKKVKATEEDEGEEKKSARTKKGQTTHGKKYFSSKKMVDSKKMYSIKDAVALLKKMKYAEFDETVELHLNVYESNIKGEVSLPAGTGKTVRVAIVDDDVIAKIESGKIDFDVLICTPLNMPKLIKFAKVLGPKGLMPNPKAGTVSDKPEEAMKKFQGGAVRYKTEAKFPLIHQAIGKMSFKDEDLSQNIEAFLNAVQSKNISAVFLKSTMSPSIRIQLKQ